MIVSKLSTLETSRTSLIAGDVAIKSGSLDKLDLPIFIKNIDGFYIYCNKALIDFLGIPRSSIIGYTAHDIAPRGLADTCVAADKKLFSMSTQLSYQSAVERNGVELSANFKKSIFYDQNGRLAGLVGTINASGNAQENALCASEKLTPREKDITKLLIRGQSVKGIARGLEISPHTVTDHLKKIYKKLDVHSKNEVLFKVLSFSKPL